MFQFLVHRVDITEANGLAKTEDPNIFETKYCLVAPKLSGEGSVPTHVSDGANKDNIMSIKRPLYFRQTEVRKALQNHPLVCPMARISCVNSS